jgi:predicted transcriptional regulator
MSKTSARISFVTPKGTRKKLDQIADAFDTNLSSVINNALDQYIDLHEWQLAHIGKGVEAAKRGDFASDKQAADFFKKYGKPA